MECPRCGTKLDGDVSDPEGAYGRRKALDAA